MTMVGCDGDMDHSTNGTMMMMQMYFYATCEATFLFKSWATTTCTEMAGASILVFVASFLYEGLKALRTSLQWWTSCRACKSTSKKSPNCCTNGGGGSQNGSGEEELILQNSSILGRMSRKQLLISLHLLQSFLYTVQVCYGFLVMLVAMTFNVWPFIAICFGAGIGYLVFNFKKVLEAVNGSDQCPEGEVGDSHCHL